MYPLGIPGIIASYILVAILLLYLNLYTSWSWKFKAAGILITSFFYIILYFSFPPILGLPSNDNPPDDFRIIGTHVQQPNDTNGRDGEIYLWLARIGTTMEIIEPPRAYKLPYTISFHEKIIGIKMKLYKGMKQLGKFDEENNVPPNEQTDKKRTSSISSKIKFYDLPEMDTISK